MVMRQIKRTSLNDLITSSRGTQPKGDGQKYLLILLGIVAIGVGGYFLYPLVPSPSEPGSGSKSGGSGRPSVAVPQTPQKPPAGAPPPKPALEGEIFNAGGKAWIVGPRYIYPGETQAWAQRIGGPWRLPSRAELVALHAEVGEKSPIQGDLVLAETKDSSLVCFFNFKTGNEHWQKSQANSHRALAIRVK
jgi:hypothetical protein